MSWIADIAGRAENILNNIDKNAATVLQNTTIRLGEEWSNKIYSNDMTNKKLNASTSTSFGSSLDDLSSSSQALINTSNQNDKMKRKAYPTKNNNNISANSFEAPNEILKLNGNESPQKINTVNVNFFDEELSKSTIVFDENSEINDLVEDGTCTNKENIIQTQSEVKNQQLENLENVLQEITNERDDLANKLNVSCNNNVTYIDTISELEINLKKSKKKYMEINEKLVWQSKETEQIKSELDNYRKKAQNTLQIKDKIIEHLKSSSDENNINNTEKYKEHILEFEINSLKEENSMRSKELQDKIDQLENQKTIIKDLNQKIIDINTKSQDAVVSLTHRFKLEQDKSIQLESQIKVINQEIYAMRQEFNRQNQVFSRELHQKEKEIMVLQSKASKNTETSNSNLNTEGKMKSLTQVLFEKQAAIETLTVERNALKLQLEKSQEQLHCVISVNRPQRTQIVNVNDTDDVKLQLPLIMKETPFDTQVARRVKRAYSSFDSAGIRVGVFLRRYPLVRIMVFIYVALLHIWVMFVLLFSTPT